MMTQDEMRVIDTMWQYGGSFVKNLSACMRVADEVNFKKLKDAFPEYWKQYDEMSKPAEDEKSHVDKK